MSDLDKYLNAVSEREGRASEAMEDYCRPNATTDAGNLLTICHDSRTDIKKLLQVVDVLREELAWYGFKMVPTSLNEGRSEITTELGKRARQALAKCDAIVSEEE
jgi:hypothetical protein